METIGTAYAWDRVRAHPLAVRSRVIGENMLAARFPVVVTAVVHAEAAAAPVVDDLDCLPTKH